MSERISEYTTSVTALASGDLMDVSKLISTSPDVYQSQKLNYSVLLTELNADLTINNLAKADLTSTAAARSFYLFGNTGSDSLRFRSLAGNPMLSLFGSGGVVIGNATTYGALQIYLSAGDATGDTYYRNSGGNVQALGIGTSGQVLTVSGGGLPSWATISAPNLGSANLTSTDDARTFTLKSGGTATQNLQFLNSGGGNLLQLKANNTIDFGSSTNNINPIFYLDATNSSNFKMYSGANLFSFINSIAYNFTIFNPTATGRQIILDGTTGRVISSGTFAGFHGFNSSGNQTLQFDIQSDNDGLFRLRSGANIKTAFYAGYGNYFIDSVAVGDTYTFTEKFRVKGSGSTSATTTALFQNSSSVNALKIRDDNYIIQRAINAPIADADLANNEMSAYIDESLNLLIFKVKYSSGAVKTVSLSLI